MRAAGIHTVQSPADIGATLQMAIGKKKGAAGAAKKSAKPAAKSKPAAKKATAKKKKR
jgi:hypothetical protein